MIIIFYISYIFACESIIEQKNIYPTEGEYYQIYMYSLFKGENLAFECRGCPYGVQLQNTLSQIGNQFESKHLFKSISSNYNNTYFVTITERQDVITYNWNGDQFNLFKSYRIDQFKYYCFNVFYTLDNNILLDCYQENQLYLCYLLNDSLITIYKQESEKPIKTKIVQIINETSIYTLYGQYYAQYQLLTLFKNGKTEYQNLSTWQYGFQDFMASQGLNRTNFAYISNNNQLYQLIVNETQQLQIVAYFYKNSKIITFSIYNSLGKNSQCDQLIVLLNLEQNKNLWHLQACDKNFIEYRSYDLNFDGINTQNLTILANEEFLILQLNYNVTIRQIDSPKKVLREHLLVQNEKFNITKLLYFETSKSILFEFGYHFIAYLVAIPNLNGYFSNNSISNNFTIYRQMFDFIDPRCKAQIQFTLLNQNDSLIYKLFEYNSNGNHIVINNGYDQIIENYSGSLLQLQSQLSEMYVGNFEPIILQQIRQNLNQSFQLATMMYVYQQYPLLFIAGILDQQIYFYFCSLRLLCHNLNQNLNQSDYQQVQMAYNADGSLIVSVSFDSNQILLFTYNFTNFAINYILIDVDPFKSILQTYNCIIILTKIEEILIMSFDKNVSYRLNTDNIKQYFPKVQFFRPIAIALNQQDQSSLLIIGNQNEILMFSITNSAILIPLTYQQLDFIIYDVRVTKKKVIIIYRDQYLLNMCFQVWEILNFNSLSFTKNLRCIELDQYSISYSDNQFFYVKLKSDNLQVYNPNLPQHMSLYYSFPFNQSFLACTFVEEFSLILQNDKLYRLQPTITMRFTPNKTFYYSTYEKVVYYSFNITTGINKTAYSITQPYTLRLINCFVNITLNKIEKDIKKDEVIILSPDVLSINSQVESYSFVNETYEHSQCVIQNSVTESKQVQYFENFNILTSVNGLFVLQSNYKLQIVGSKQEFIYNSMGICFQSYAYYSTLYSICQNKLYQLNLISFSINTTNIEKQSTYVLLTEYNNPKQLIVLFDLYFILGQLNKETNIIVFIAINYTTVTLTNCRDCTYFSVSNFRNITKASQQISFIALFYICSQQLYYKIIQFNQITQELIQQTQEQQVSFFKFPTLLQIRPVQFLILKNYYSEIIAVLTTSNYCTFIISITYDSTKSHFQPQQIIQTIPPYGNFVLKYSQIANGILMNAYQNHSQYHYIFYNLTSIKAANLSVPLLIFGALPSQTQQYLTAFHYNFKSHSGQILQYYEKNGIIYNINRMSIICNFNLSILAKSEKFKYYLKAQNAFGYNETELIFSYQRDQNNWAYGLITIVAVCLIVAIYIYWKKLRSVEPVNNDQEDEFEL